MMDDEDSWLSKDKAFRKANKNLSNALSGLGTGTRRQERSKKNAHEDMDISIQQSTSNAFGIEAEQQKRSKRNDREDMPALVQQIRNEAEDDEDDIIWDSAPPPPVKVRKVRKKKRSSQEQDDKAEVQSTRSLTSNSSARSEMKEEMLEKSLIEPKKSPAAFLPPEDRVKTPQFLPQPEPVPPTPELVIICSPQKAMKVKAVNANLNVEKPSSGVESRKKVSFARKTVSKPTQRPLESTSAMIQIISSPPPKRKKTKEKSSQIRIDESLGTKISNDQQEMEKPPEPAPIQRIVTPPPPRLMINDKENEIVEGQPATNLVDGSTIPDNSVLQGTLEPEPVPQQIIAAPLPQSSIDEIEMAPVEQQPLQDRSRADVEVETRQKLSKSEQSQEQAEKSSLKSVMETSVMSGALADISRTPTPETAMEQDGKPPAAAQVSVPMRDEVEGSAVSQCHIPHTPDAELEMNENRESDDPFDNKGHDRSERIGDLTAILIESARVFAAAASEDSDGGDSKDSIVIGGVAFRRRYSNVPRHSSGFDIFKRANFSASVSVTIRKQKEKAKEKDKDKEEHATITAIRPKTKINSTDASPVSVSNIHDIQSTSVPSTSQISPPREFTGLPPLRLTNRFPYLPRISRTPSPFETITRHPKLAEAQQALKEGERTFACEYGDGKGISKGAPRYYINARLDEFWREYVKMDPNTRYFYEIIPADTPCRLHFDLEFEKTGKNEHVKPENAYGNFIRQTTNLIQEKFDIDINQKNILTLESSSDTKFSCHTIIDLNGKLFPSNAHVREFVNLIEKMILSTTRFKIYNNGNGQPITIIDTGIYNKNRNFRLFGSTKAFKNRPLKLADCCKKYEGIPDVSEEMIFYDSLVVPKDFDKCELIETSSFMPQQISMDNFVLGPGERQLSSIQVESAEVAEWSQEHELLQAGEENQMEEQMQVVESEAEANQERKEEMFMKEEMKVSAQPQLEPPRMPISRSAQSYFNTWEDRSDTPPQLCTAQNYQDDNGASVANALQLNNKAVMKELKEPPFKGRSQGGKFYRNKAPSPSPIPLFEKFVVELLR
ncbi:hypothetical protein WR25_03020 [Diploscapter pachys]|uniref:DNA-directed primase/polymerase protein n=1 Tax=Diploscapter pachys TaxID=2018661 RepID=A0A2A2LUD9_9BILA|nr:hypothetical protein WR25_03020 [Diploscapter pachys]